MGHCEVPPTVWVLKLKRTNERNQAPQMNASLIADPSGVAEGPTMNNKFAHHPEVQVPVQMAMSVDNGPTPLEVSGDSSVQYACYFRIFDRFTI